MTTDRYDRLRYNRGPNKAERRNRTARMVRGLLQVNGHECNPVEVDCISMCRQYIDCEGYKDCLFIGAYADWSQFTCEHCKVYKEMRNERAKRATR